MILSPFYERYIIMHKKKKDQKEILTFQKGMKDGLPIGLGYLSVSFAFGVTAGSLGLPWLISVFISMTNLTSAGQLAGVTVIAAAGSFAEIIATQLVINARYFFMSVSLSQKLDKSFTVPARLLCACGITDEIFAVAVSNPGKINRRYFFGLMILPYLGWTLGTLVGSLMGNILPTPVLSALNIAIYAMFIAIIVPPCKEQKGILVVVLTSALISSLLYTLPFLSGVSTGIACIFAALVAAAIAAFLFPVKEDNALWDI